MYNQKIKFDKKCEESKQPRETMEQFMYTYLNQKYGLKNLIIEWAIAIVNGVCKHSGDDHEVYLFGKIIKNECDEEFRFIQMHVKDTLFNLLKVLFKDKFPFKGEMEVMKMLEQTHNGFIEEWMWRKIIEKMYDPMDADILEQKFLEQIYVRDEVCNYVCNGISFGQSYLAPTEKISENKINQFLSYNKINLQYAKKLSRDEINNIHRRNQGKLVYQDFSKIILDFQLFEHEKFLKRFTELFKQIDTSSHGILTES